MKFGKLFQEKGVIFIFCILAKTISKKVNKTSKNENKNTGY